MRRLAFVLGRMSRAFAGTTCAALAVFYKSLETYIYTQNVRWDFTGYDDLGIMPISNWGNFSTPVNGSGGYMRGEGYCHFDSREFAGFDLTSGEETYVGDLAVPRTADQKDPACASETPAPRGGRAARR